MNTRAAEVVRWDAGDVCGHLDELLGVYGAAMGYPRSMVAARRGILSAHTRHTAFRAVATLDVEGRVLGFGYGYRSAPGQWWHEQVRAGLDAAGYANWLADCFELVELHVLPRAQGQGLGHRQLVLLLDGIAQRRVLLSTPEGESRAWRLYRRTGFVDVLRDHTFVGDTRPFAVLGRALPRAADDA